MTELKWLSRTKTRRIKYIIREYKKKELLVLFFVCEKREKVRACKRVNEWDEGIFEMANF